MSHQIDDSESDGPDSLISADTVGGTRANAKQTSGRLRPDAPADEASTLNATHSTLRREVVQLQEASNYELLDEYWLREPFAFVAIFEDSVTEKGLYYLTEPDLDEGESALYEKFTHTLKDELLYRESLEEGADREAALEDHVRSQIDTLPGFDPPTEAVEKVLYFLKRDLIGYERIDPLMHDPQLEEVSCNGVGPDKPIFIYHREYEDLETNIYYPEGSLRPFVQKLAQRSGKDISTANPTQGAALPNGSRLQLTRQEISPEGDTFTIRKFSDEPFTPIDLVEYGTFDVEQLAYLWLLIEHDYSGIIAGGTGAGKTTTMNALALFIPPGRKVITLEDTREVKLPQKNKVATLTREEFVTQDNNTGVDMFALLKSALRMRPVYMVVGEVRGEEAYNMFQAMNTGHTTFATLHADSMQTALSRLESEPMKIPKNLIAELGFVLIQTSTKMGDERVRRLKTINEVTELDPKTKQLRYEPTWEWDSNTDTIQKKSTTSSLVAEMRDRGLNPDESFQERVDLLEYLSRNGISDYDRVTTVVRAYMRSSEIVMEQVRDGALDFEMLTAVEEGFKSDALN